MELISDGLLLATALTAAVYCIILSRRLRRLTDSGEGIAAQIAALDAALGETKAAMTETRRGIADARVTVRSAREGLDKAIAAARSEAEALRRASEAARAAHPPPLPSPGLPSAEVAAWEEDAAADNSAVLAREEDRNLAASEEDDIPDWPGGLVDLPAEAAEALRQPASDYGDDHSRPYELSPEYRIDAPPKGESNGPGDVLDDGADAGSVEPDSAGSPIRVRRMSL